MEEEILGADEDFQVLATSNQSQNPDDIFFNQVVQALQEIIVDDRFQESQTGFMRENCHLFDCAEENKIEYMPIFHEYQNNVSKCLEEMLGQIVPGFEMQKFISMLSSHSDQIDQEIMEILVSFCDFEVFKQLMLDYKAGMEEQERYMILTVKTNKIPQQKRVKGASDNIFATKPINLEKGPLLKKLTTKNPSTLKTQQQLLVPDLVLTIRPLRKG